jgi:amino acid adenylation domain-containing protein
MTFLLQHLLSETASQYPEKDAITFRDQRITYGRLERESNKLAHELLARGLTRGARVGIHMNRGIGSIIAAFGVLKAGATYVPIDPMSPTRRITYIINKCEIGSLLTRGDKLSKITDVFPAQSPLRNIFVMDGIDIGAEIPGSTRLVDCQLIPEELGDSAPAVNCVDRDIAYILFTSGSTGDPKGVMISHLNSLTFVNSASSFFGIEKEDKFSNISPLHFDMSVFDIFVALRAAASVVVIPETTALFPVKLAELIEESKVSVWNSVPSALSLLATYKNLSSHDFSSLRLVLFAGEQFPLKYLRQLEEVIPGARFCNMYGQTEANSSTYYWVKDFPADAKTSLPIGKPLPNFEVFAIDEDGKKVTEQGKEGELYVRASTVALGYWDEAEKTKKSFVRNPLRPELNETVYKTGDLVHMDADGNYVFRGRKDHMIKSRGYRIEVGEIETVLSNHSAIRNVVVIPIPDEFIGNRISVIVVPMEPGGVSKEEILRYCSQQLPKYMVPEMVEFRDMLPTTSSGKVDRKQLSEAVETTASCIRKAE